MDAEGILMPLLFLDEMVVPPKLAEHIGCHHGAPVCLVKEIRELLSLRAVIEAECKERIWFNRNSLGFFNLLPEHLASMPRRSDLGHLGLVAGDLSTLAPGFQVDDTARFPAGHFHHEVHPRNHQAVVQKSELHVLATNGRSCIVLLAMAANFFQHLRVDFKAAPLGQEVERLAVIFVNSCVIRA